MTAAVQQKSRLGRGLAALMGDQQTPIQGATPHMTVQSHPTRPVDGEQRWTRRISIVGFSSPAPVFSVFGRHAAPNTYGGSNRFRRSDSRLCGANGSRDPHALEIHPYPEVRRLKVAGLRTCRLVPANSHPVRSRSVRVQPTRNSVEEGWRWSLFDRSCATRSFASIASLKICRNVACV